MDLPVHVLPKGVMCLGTTSGKTQVKASSNPWEGIRTQKPMWPWCKWGCASGCVQGLVQSGLAASMWCGLGAGQMCMFPSVRPQEDLAIEGTKAVPTVRGTIGSGTVGSGRLWWWISWTVVVCLEQQLEWACRLRGSCVPGAAADVTGTQGPLLAWVNIWVQLLGGSTLYMYSH